LLTTGAQDAPERQQTLRNTIAWSYDLLSAGEQALFRRTAIFAGGCTIEAVEAACRLDSEPEGDILDRLDSLVDKSLLVVLDAEAETEAGPRVTMLETVREYALEQLEANGEAAAMRDRHLGWCLALAEQAEQESVGPQQGVWLDRLEVEHDNLRVALRWAYESTQVEVGLQVAGALEWFWDVRGYLSERRKWLEDLLTGGARGTTPSSAGVRAKALLGAGCLAERQGDNGVAVGFFEQSLALSRRIQDKRIIAASLYHLGRIAQDVQEYERATFLHEESLNLSREIGDQQGIGRSLRLLGTLAWERRDFLRATALYQECLALYQQMGDRGRIAGLLIEQGGMALEQGDAAMATARFEESLALGRHLGHKHLIAIALNNLGEVARAQGDPLRAADLYEESLALYRALGRKQGLAVTFANLGHVARDQGQYPRAVALYAESLILWRDLGDKKAVAECLEGLAAATFAQEQPESAVILFGAATALRDSIGAPLVTRDRRDHEGMLLAAQAALGEHAFAVAWEAGRTLGLEQPISKALLSHVRGGSATGIAPPSDHN
jgi:tetratricopeptide (TPR) repeat protein